MANRKLIVEVVGDSRSLQRTFAQSSRASRKFASDTTTSLGKVDAAFTRTQRIAAGGFIGGAAVASIINVTKVAAEAEQVLGQTRVALESTGASWEVYGQQIEDAVRAQSRLGFDDEALLRSFSNFQRTTGDVTKSLKLNNLAMDLARARFIDLESAAQLVTKAALGQAGALRRVGIDTTGATTSTQLLTLLTEKYGGSAQKAAGDAATAFDRMNVQIENAKEAAGTLALPVMTNVAKFVDAAAASVIRFADALGGLEKQSDRLTFGDLFSSVLDLPEVFRKSLVPPWEWDEVASSQRAAADRAFQQAFANFGQDGVFDLDAIRRSMDDTFQADGTFDIPAIRARLQGRTGESKDAAARAREILNEANGNLRAVLASQVKRRDSLGKLLENARKNFNDQKKIDDLAVRYAQAQARVIGTQQTIAANDKQAADAARESARTAKETARATAEAAREQAKVLEQIRQFRALGLDATGAKPPPTIANLLKQITQLGQQDLTKNQRGILARIRKVLVDPLHKATTESRAAAKGLIDGIRSELDPKKLDAITGPLTRTSGLRTNAIVQGLGLDPAQIRALRARLSHFNTAGLGRTGNISTAGGFRQPVIENHVTVELDGQVVSKKVTSNQQKSKKRNPVQKRGSRRGGI